MFNAKSSHESRLNLSAAAAGLAALLSRLSRCPVAADQAHPVFDHAKLVMREPREMARYRRWALGRQPGFTIGSVSFEHAEDDRCCKRENYVETLRKIELALSPPVPLLILGEDPPWVNKPA
jgi:hypothetical protein